MIRPFLDNLWRWKAGVSEIDLSARPMPDLESLRDSEQVEEIDRFCRNRLIMGAFRYGLIRNQDYSKYDLPGEAIIRIRQYEKTRNLEHLVDAINMCKLSYINGRRRGELMQAGDDTRHTPQINI